MSPLRGTPRGTGLRPVIFVVSLGERSRLSRRAGKAQAVAGPPPESPVEAQRIVLIEAGSSPHSGELLAGIAGYRFAMHENRRVELELRNPF